MKLLLFAAGVLTGLAFSRIPHYLDHYSTYSLPKPEHEGPKYAIGGRYVTRPEFDEWTERYAQMGAVPA